MNYQIFSTLTLIGIATLCLILFDIPSGPERAEKEGLMPNQSSLPNIIVMMADDMGFSDLGCYGGEIHTPQLDSLAYGGLRFTQFYNTGRCCPTRASLLTGLYPAQTGVGHMMSDRGQPGYRGDLNDHCMTIAEVLKPAGYRTYMSGKWHVTSHLQAVDSLQHNWPLQRGFEKYYGNINGAGSFWDPYTLTRGNDLISPRTDSLYQPHQYYYTDAVSDNAVRFLGEHQEESPEQPFFLYVAYTAPHWPLHAPEEEIIPYSDMYQDGYQDVREKRLERAIKIGIIDKDWALSDATSEWDTVEYKDWHSKNMQVYAAMITRMDKGVGKIVQQLRRMDVLDNTLILFLQDNGGCAEELNWMQNDTTVNISGTEPPYPAISDATLQTSGRPTQTREGFAVMVQNKQVMSGPEESYNAYGPAWANVSNTPFRKFKHWVHEGGISTPLVAHWPAAIADPGSLRHQPSHLIDIMATCIDISGATYPQDYESEAIIPYEGESLLPVIRENADMDRTSIFFEHEGNRAVRQHRWKLVSKAYDQPRYMDNRDTLDFDQWELYDMQKDRTETRNLAAEHPDIVRAMSDVWYGWALRTQTIPKPKG